MAQQYAQAARATREAAMAVAPDIRYVVQTPSFGADSVRLVSLIYSWDELNQGPRNPGQMTREHYGETLGAALADAAGATISNIAMSLNRPRPDLAYQPE